MSKHSKAKSRRRNKDTRARRRLNKTVFQGATTPTAKALIGHAKRMPRHDVRAMIKIEENGKARKTVLSALTKRLAKLDAA